MVGARRKAVESLYKGVCTVKAWQPVTDPITNITKNIEVTLYENQKCKLSSTGAAFVSSSAKQSTAPAFVTQTKKIFIAPELNIPPGCKIIVTQNGVTNEYTRSGKSSVYMDHQEVPVDLFERYA